MLELLKAPDTVVLHEEKDKYGKTLMVLAVSPIGINKVEAHLAASKDISAIRLIKLCLHYIKIFDNMGYEIYIESCPELIKFNTFLGFEIIKRGSEMVEYKWTGRKL